MITLKTKETELWNKVREVRVLILNPYIQHPTGNSTCISFHDSRPKRRVQSGVALATRWHYWGTEIEANLILREFNLVSLQNYFVDKVTQPHHPSHRHMCIEGGGSIRNVYQQSISCLSGSVRHVGQSLCTEKGNGKKAIKKHKRNKVANK
jgi:hypothetical protein